MLPTIIEQVLNNANVFVFGEILAEPKVAAMKTGDAGAKKSFATLELFAYSTFSDYQKNKAKFIDLKPKMLDKLKMLSLTDLCMKNSSITFDQIKTSTGCASNDEAEELVLKCV
jgi:COP9 signalosome complex subunit 7